jgi:sec-independent protein translocase protein TatB
MPSFQDSAFIFLLALLLFGPKKLPVLARQLGKLMGDFRRASNEFRSQMEEELRGSEQADRQKQIAALESAAPSSAHEPIPEPVHPHLPELASEAVPEATSQPAVPHIPIATSGELSLMPPSTGLPIANSSLTPFLESIPSADQSAPHEPESSPTSANHTAELETETLHG